MSLLRKAPLHPRIVAAIRPPNGPPRPAPAPKNRLACITPLVQGKGSAGTGTHQALKQSPLLQGHQVARNDRADGHHPTASHSSNSVVGISEIESRASSGRVAHRRPAMRDVIDGALFQCHWLKSNRSYRRHVQATQSRAKCE